MKLKLLFVDAVVGAFGKDGCEVDDGGDGLVRFSFKKPNSVIWKDIVTL